MKLALKQRYAQKTIKNHIWVGGSICKRLLRPVITRYKTLWMLSSVGRGLKTANDGQWTLNFPVSLFPILERAERRLASEWREGKRGGGEGGEGLDLFLLCRPRSRSLVFLFYTCRTRSSSVSQLTCDARASAGKHAWLSHLSASI